MWLIEQGMKMLGLLLTESSGQRTQVKIGWPGGILLASKG